MKHNSITKRGNLLGAPLELRDKREWLSAFSWKSLGKSGHKFGKAGKRQQGKPVHGKQEENI